MRASRMFVLLAVVLCVAGCAPRADSSASGGIPADRPGALKRVQAAIMSEPPNLKSAIDPTGITRPGSNVLEDLVSVGLSRLDKQGVRRAQLAEDVPTVENGSWKLLTDGRMETTWRLRPEARWHDGVPVLSTDVLFTARLRRDRELPFSPTLAFDYVERIEAPDPQTIFIAWKQPYIDADAVFDDLLPLHLLDKPYTEDKQSFVQLPYWADEFVGTGTFRLKQWNRGVSALLEANPFWVFGRPRLDEIEVHFVPDPNTLSANILAGAVELTLGKSLSLEQSMQLNERWKAGSIDTTPANWLVMFPQFVNASPAVIGNVQFRRALMHAIDRQQMIDTLMYGQSTIAHSFMFPNQIQYQEIEARLPRYEYNPARALQMIEGLGYARGSDGAFLDRTGERLAVELRTVTVDLNQKVILTVADHWARIGIPTEPVVIPPQRVGDQEYVATFPGFLLYRNPNDVGGFSALHGSKTRLPENGFRGSNNNRYMNPEFDARLDRYLQTIPKPERTSIIGDIIYHIADQVTLMGLFYDSEPTMIGNRLRNVAARHVRSTQAWNAYEWDLTN